MKNTTGKIIGFVLGVAGFLVLFKIFLPVRIPPEDEIAPGIVVLASIFNGVLFGIIGSVIQSYFTRKQNYE